MSVRRYRPRERLTLPTTLAGAEWCVLVAFVGLRVIDLVQLGVSLRGDLSNATRPWLAGALMAVYLVESIAITTAVIRAKRYYSLRWAILDTSLAFVILVAQLWFTTSDQRVGTWTAWGFAVSVGTALGVGIGFPRLWQTWLGATLLAGAYLVVSWPDTSPGARSAAVSNAVAYFGFALVGRALATYLRRMGRDADAARDEAERLGREHEYDRHRRLLHDQATVLALVSQGLGEGPLSGALQLQAGLAAGEIRAFLKRDADTIENMSKTQPGTITEIIHEVAAAFPDLDFDLNIELAERAVLPLPTAEALKGALRAVLHNVRVHASASHVVVHADIDPEADRWEITVHDDGMGFDPATTAPGFGLAEQLVRALGEVAVTTAIDSAPECGTTIVMTGPAVRIGVDTT